jgi:hypothetical protein
LQAKPPKQDAHHDPSPRTYCLVQAAAQHTHLSQVNVSTMSSCHRGLSTQSAEPVLPPRYFNPAPLSQRAPPRA